MKHIIIEYSSYLKAFKSFTDTLLTAGNLALVGGALQKPDPVLALL